MIYVKIITSFLITLLNGFFSYYVITKNHKDNKENKIILFVSVFIMCLALEIITKYTDVLRMVCSYLSMIIIFLVNDKSNLKFDTIAYTFFNIYGIVLEVLLMIIITILLSIDYTNMPFVIEQLIAVAFTIIWPLSWYFITKRFHFSIFFKKIEKIISHIFTIELFLILIFISISTLAVEYYLGNISSKIVVIYVLIINLLIFVLSMCIKNINKKKQLQIQNEYLVTMVEEYEKIVNDYREMKHNLMSDFLIIKSVANKESGKIVDRKIKEYYKNYHWINELSKIPKGLQGLIYVKSKEAKSKKVKLFVKVKSKIKEIHLLLDNKTYNDFYKGLSLLIDNAIEGAAQSKQKTIIIDISDKNQSVCIRLCNTFDDSIDLDKIGKRGYSTKGKSRGIGLYYIFNKLSKNIIISNHIINNVYEVTIIVKLKRAI